MDHVDAYDICVMVQVHVLGNTCFVKFFALEKRLKVNLYWIAALLAPTAEQKAKGDGYSVVMNPVLVAADDQKTAVLKSYAHLPEDVKGKEDRLKFRVLTFQES